MCCKSVLTLHFILLYRICHTVTHMPDERLYLLSGGEVPSCLIAASRARSPRIGWSDGRGMIFLSTFARAIN